METLSLTNDIKVMYVTAKSFPDGILEARQTLHKVIPFATNRKYFGLSRPEDGVGIVYRAAAEEINQGEAEQINCNTLVIKKGNYLGITISDYMHDLSSIGRTFKQLLESPDLDPQGYCVEWYLSKKDVKCMIRLKD
ncbi:transcriptional regulator [Solitalea koreensis]|uniref:Uncharacterized protein n=1 Tax=Solitalea koreensis TaxID=543615 RepID=A0A521AQ75_9SPHI|nr:transcriptional regulator [Solitalea koreensis]SMO36958.1 hypothetical protein SAMN06265350_101313 [Solitalea koreensis]